MENLQLFRNRYGPLPFCGENRWMFSISFPISSIAIRINCMYSMSFHFMFRRTSEKPFRPNPARLMQHSLSLPWAAS
ncbi:MAG: hypothetical protein K0R28_7113 [Paenibacillus sp.]|jgi:hypothetical protein|nr:hypothetical protein [Paenibacillus sp.]